MHNTPLMLLLGWLGVSSLIALLLFGLDKFCAGRLDNRRISETHLCLIGAAGGWPGGLLGMLVFRHKTSKLTFQIKYALAFVVWAAWVYWAWKRWA